MGIYRENPPRATILDVAPQHTENSITAGERTLVGFASECSRRMKNDDCCRVAPRMGFAALSDGIGGAPYGDVASLIGCESAVAAFAESGSLQNAFEVANTRVLSVFEWMGLSKAGSGATLLLVDYGNEGAVNILSAGDSSAFILSDGSLTKLCGKEKGARFLTSGIGFDGHPDLTLLSRKVSPGDRLLFCSDGVPDALDEQTIVSLLSSEDAVSLVAGNIAKRAAEKGTDNATALVLIIEKEARGLGNWWKRRKSHGAYVSDACESLRQGKQRSDRSEIQRVDGLESLFPRGRGCSTGLTVEKHS